RPSEPVETVSTSIDLGFLPSRMIEPLPKLRSICESAASRAFDLSMENPSTIRSARAICFAPYDGDSKDRQTDRPLSDAGNVHHLFLVRNMFFWEGGHCPSDSTGGSVIVPIFTHLPRDTARAETLSADTRRSECSSFSWGWCWD